MSTASRMTFFRTSKEVYYVGFWLLLVIPVTYIQLKTDASFGLNRPVLAVIDSLTSVLVIAALTPFIYRSITWGKNRVQIDAQKIAKVVFRHTWQFLAFSFIHVFVMVTLRHWIYPFVGIEKARWDFIERWTFELPKDFMVYIPIVMGCLLFKIIAANAKPKRLRNSFTESELTVLVDGNSHRLPLREVQCVLAEGNYVNLVTSTDSLLSRMKLSEVESKLSDRFLRIHRSSIVNLSAIRKTVPLEKGEIELELEHGQKLKVSRSRRADFLQAYNDPASSNSSL